MDQYRINLLLHILFGLILLFLALAIGVAYTFLGPITAIKAAYALVGTVIAAILFLPTYSTEKSPAANQNRAASHIGRLATKLVLVTVILSSILTYVTGNRLITLIAAVTVSSAAILYQLLDFRYSKYIAAQLIMLFSIGPITRYISTGFYFGGGDLLGHVQAVEFLLRSGELGIIENAYSTYSAFPALHIISATLSANAGLGAYDALILFGMITYAVTALAVIYSVSSLFSLTKGIAVGFVFVSLSLVQHSASYFYPQALATAVFILILYEIIRQRSIDPEFHPHMLMITLMTVIVFSISHHVTQIIFTGIVVGLFIPSLFSLAQDGQAGRVNALVPRPWPLLITVTSGLAYLSWTTAGIVGYFVSFVLGLLNDPVVSDSGGGREVIGLGAEIPYQTVETALLSVFYVDGIYYISLAVLFVVGFAAITARFEYYMKYTGYLLLGLFGSLFVLKTPFVGIASRLALPLAVFFSIIAGLGLFQLLQIGREIRSEEGRLPLGRSVLAILVIMMFAVTGPLVAGDDLYWLHSGPNLWETYSTPEQQVDFSDQELRELQSTVDYVDRHTSRVTMLVLTREVSEHRFEGEPRAIPTISESGITADHPLVYRMEWKRHQVAYSTDIDGTLLIADWWIDREIGASNKIYTTGNVGMITSGDGTHLSANRTLS